MYSKEITPMCIYCFYSEKVFNDGMSCLCTKRGVVAFDYSCRKYEYDPIKRTPPRPKAFESLDIEIAEI